MAAKVWPSSHYQYVKELVADCDMDTILAKVSQVGAACHTGSRSCFFNEITKKDYEESNNPLQVFEEVFDVIKDRKVHPKGRVPIPITCSTRALTRSLRNWERKLQRS